MRNKISILELNTEAFENAEVKNAFIRSAGTEWIGFVNQDVTKEEEVCQLLEENPFLMDKDVILFGDNVPEGECGQVDLLAHPLCDIYVLIFRKELLIRTGSYNRLLPGSSNYEFLLRLAEKGRVYAIPCGAETKGDFNPTTMAYIVRRYMEGLKGSGSLDRIFLGMVQAAKQLGVAEAFTKAMNLFLGDAAGYERLAADTAPCLILGSSDRCYGVIARFADSLADELVGLGQAVITTNDRYGDYSRIPKDVLLKQSYKAIIGFQSPVLESEAFRNMKGKRYQFWFDNPMLSISFFQNASKQTFLLCQDVNYASFIREHYQMEHAVQLPPGGDSVGINCEEPIYELVFVGCYIAMPKPNYEEAFQRDFFHYMLSHENDTVEQGIKKLWQEQGIEYDEQRFMEAVGELRDVFIDLLQVYRHRVVETILSAGIQLHVYGDSWEDYQGLGREHLIRHPQVVGEEAWTEWKRAKIGLNIMRGHKGGMTERVANIMLCGTCCLTDTTTYLEAHFTDGEDIVLFRGDALEELPGKIRYLLEHDEEREKIARAGREKALREHTWRTRTEELLEIIEKEM